ncbi:MAG: CatB-related O-acetyltransferase [Planctomycetota bacterium]
MRKILLRALVKLEGGEMVSRTLRRIYSEYHRIDIGMYSYGGCFDLRLIKAPTRIGRYCSFGSGVCVFSANHPLEHKSTHPFFYAPAFGYVQKEERLVGSIEIGNDVWIGRNAIILSGTGRIGDGAVIGAGSVVTKEVPDFAVVAGSPARIIRYRFSEATVEKLKRERWWDKDIAVLKENIDQFVRPLEQDTGEVR